MNLRSVFTLLLLIIMSGSSLAQEKTSITGMTIAVTEMDKMVDFYSNVFGLEFDEVKMYGTLLYKTQLGQLEILFCPASIAQNTAKQNKHQLNFEIKNLQSTLGSVVKYGGSVLGEPSEEGAYLQVGIKDPDNNSIVLKQKL